MQTDSDADARRMQAALRDVVALSAIAAAWIETEPDAVAAGLADTIVSLLQLDFAFVRLRYRGGEGPDDVTRGSAWTRFPEWLERHAGTTAQFPGKAVFADVGDAFTFSRHDFHLHTGAGAELRAEVVLGWILPTDLRFGCARGLESGPVAILDCYAALGGVF